MTKKELQVRIKELEEQLAFWMGEDECKTEEELEWLELARLDPQKRTPVQTRRARELGRLIMRADKTYWKNRAAKAEKKLKDLKVVV